MPPTSASFLQWVLRLRPGQSSAASRNVPSLGEADEPATLADSHLVMNALNQMAASMHARSGEEDPRLFALADYLRIVLRYGTEESIAVHEEFLLLQSYIQLVARNRLLDIPFEFSPGQDDDVGRRHMVQRHLAADLVGALLRALPNELARTSRLRIGFEGSSTRYAYALRATLFHPDGAAFEARLRAEVGSFVDRFGASCASTIGQSYTYTGDLVSWSVTVAGTPLQENAR